MGERLFIIFKLLKVKFLILRNSASVNSLKSYPVSHNPYSVGSFTPYGLQKIHKAFMMHSCTMYIHANLYFPSNLLIIQNKMLHYQFSS